MIYDKQEECSTFYSTLCFSILYTDDIKLFLEGAESFVPDIISPKFLDTIIAVFTKYSEHGRLSRHSLSNIYEFANYCRFNDKVLKNLELKKEIYEYCNQLIMLANSQRYNNQKSAYYEEILRRFFGPIEVVFKMLLYKADSQRMMDAINYMRELDFIILCINSGLVDEDEFDLELVSLLADPYYLICIEYLLNVHPILFKDKLFCQRTLKGLEANHQLILEAHGTPLKESFYEIADDDDISILNNKSFIKTNQKLKRRIGKLKKDS